MFVSSFLLGKYPRDLPTDQCPRFYRRDQKPTGCRNSRSHALRICPPPTSENQNNSDVWVIVVVKKILPMESKDEWWMTNTFRAVFWYAKEKNGLE